MADKDTVTKDYMSDNATFADLFNFYTHLYSKSDNRFVQRRILSRRTTAVVLSHCKGVQRGENSSMCEDIIGVIANQENTCTNLSDKISHYYVKLP